MRFAICDDDEMAAFVVDAALSVSGHELVGVADTAASAIGLVEHARPEVVVLDPSVGCSADHFDVIDAAISVGAHVVVFSRNVAAVVPGRYDPAPHMVQKPNITALESWIDRLATPMSSHEVIERRRQPPRSFDGPASAGPSDAAAFYAAANEAIEGDALVAVVPRFERAKVWVDRVALATRQTDFLLITSSAVLVFLPAGGEDGVLALHDRLIHDGAGSTEGEVRAVVLDADESTTDAFARLKDPAGDS
jgi:hypothetical protein